jgi:hypothetical protein
MFNVATENCGDDEGSSRLKMVIRDLGLVAHRTHEAPCGEASCRKELEVLVDDEIVVLRRSHQHYVNEGKSISCALNDLETQIDDVQRLLLMAPSAMANSHSQTRSSAYLFSSTPSIVTALAGQSASPPGERFRTPLLALLETDSLARDLKGKINELEKANSALQRTNANLDAKVKTLRLDLREAEQKLKAQKLENDALYSSASRSGSMAPSLPQRQQREEMMKALEAEYDQKLVQSQALHREKQIKTCAALFCLSHFLKRLQHGVCVLLLLFSFPGSARDIVIGAKPLLKLPACRNGRLNCRNQPPPPRTGTQDRSNRRLHIARAVYVDIARSDKIHAPL